MGPINEQSKTLGGKLGFVNRAGRGTKCASEKWRPQAGLPARSARCTVATYIASGSGSGSGPVADVCLREDADALEGIVRVARVVAGEPFRRRVLRLSLAKSVPRWRGPRLARHPVRYRARPAVLLMAHLPTSAVYELPVRLSEEVPGVPFHGAVARDHVTA